MAPRKMPWFRFYAETVTDRKIRRLKVEHRWLWVTVLCAARQSPIEGWLMLSDEQPVEPVDLADLGALTERQVTAGLTALEKAGLVRWDTNLDAWEVPKWNDRQRKSDTSTDRVRAHRDRQRNGDETLHARSSNGGRNAPEVEVEVETDNNPPTPLQKGGEPRLSSSAGHVLWNGDVPATQGRPEQRNDAVAQLHQKLGVTDAPQMRGLS